MRSINPRTGTEMTPNETIIYNELVRAAEAGEPCPLNLDLEMMIGCSSSSGAPTVVKRLEQRGLIVVIRYQRFRQVKICATGRWTMKAPNQQTTSKHVPRGCGAGSRSGGKVRVSRGAL
ncbi:hypothetical protein [Novosphingobium sp. ST904]|uniref:hypothetical protein n=1 Tax=Novosphingobium sp. ST904 TaxID=1684385 RepID=UPI0006C8BFBF|nr:hypothetical protein [Novosphingobium sp. ST904]KPH67547.1 hypothetical protein ADT71_02280 [Novosphingobium sp. ST904]TCM30052.1 hypothetical protein EDF59_12779 [Novosphingobium sp. ST904]